MSRRRAALDGGAATAQRLGMLILHYHPYTRAANVVWMLEEVGVDYELKFVDLMAGEHKRAELLALNPMGKLPTLEDGELVVTESAAIGLYLADRYAPGRLAPALEDPARGTYFRWSLFAPSVIEPGAAGRTSQWKYEESTVGWGNYDRMIDAMQSAVSNGDFLLGDAFSMADVIFGGTLRFMLQFKMIDPRPAFESYVDRISARPAAKRAQARNEAIIAERGLAK